MDEDKGEICRGIVMSISRFDGVGSEGKEG